MRSMTGCGRCTVQSADGWTMTVELRSVNHRFLDVACKLPRELSFLEDTVRKGIASGLKRGHVETYVTVARDGGSDKTVTVDDRLAERYVAAARRIAEAAGAQLTLNAADLLTLDGVVQVTDAALAEEDATALCREAVAGAVQRITQMRDIEGAALRDDLSEHLEKAAALRESILQRAPGVIESYRARLNARLEKLPIEPVDPARLAQEVAIMADRCAIDEELSRLQSHITQMSAFLNTEGEIGKKMDFLVQEMNREANTIGSKANDAGIAQCVVDLKSEIEKLREQIQNVE